MQLTLYATRRTPHGASRLVQAMSAWSVKIRRAPSGHCRDARVCGRTTTTVHNLSTPPPPPPDCTGRETTFQIFGTTRVTAVDTVGSGAGHAEAGEGEGGRA